jgi:predicted DNA-binding protein
MKRTLVLLTEEQHRRLTEMAKRQGNSMAALIRAAIDAFLKEKEKSS